MTKKEKEIQSSSVILDKDQSKIQEEFSKLIESDFDIEKAVSSLVTVYKSQIQVRKNKRKKHIKDRGKEYGKADKSSMEGSDRSS